MTVHRSAPLLIRIYFEDHGLQLNGQIFTKDHRNEQMATSILTWPPALIQVFFIFIGVWDPSKQLDRIGIEFAAGIV